jgi:PAS domain-containing protein
MRSLCEAGVTAASRQVKSDPKLAGDIPVLKRKWQAALRPGQVLPLYEDVMLGSLGRLADHIVLVKGDQAELEVSRTGRYVQDWLGDDRWDIPLSELSPDCATALAEAAASALRNNQPHLAAANCVRGGIVQTYDILALPTLSRWGGKLIGIYVAESGDRYNLLDAIFSATDDGIVSLAAIRDCDSRAFDFQIVHLNQGAARLLRQSSSDLQWHRLGTGGHALCQVAVSRAAVERHPVRGRRSVRNRQRPPHASPERHRVRRPGIAHDLRCDRDEEARGILPLAVR